MNFELTEEQQLVSDSIERFVKENYDLESRVKIANQAPGFSKDYWQTMSELGWLGLPFSEDQGGFGGDQLDTMVLMEQFGKGLVLEPYLASVILGGGAVKRSATEAQRKTWLDGVIDGSKQLALAYAEPESGYEIENVAMAGSKTDSGYSLTGTKCMVLHGGTADAFVVSFRTSGGVVDQAGISLAIIPADREGLSVQGFPTVDGLQSSELTFDKVAVSADDLLGDADAGFETLNATINDGILAVAAEALGAMEILYKDTVAYTQDREQFGHPLAEFQVLQHRMVEMFMEYEQCKSLLIRATMEVASGGKDAQRNIHALKHLIGKASSFVGENAVQTHGGMGVTEELRLGHYFKRLLVIEAQFGNTDFHLDQFAA
ncbi:MAG: alkylation response protein AidB-like acyl-CoA dehydrogenase [Candidatus Azotimanducaceae bacterium]|jgi:alkylation response protein AidB-like acyl-CoA dehydrogenase